MGGGGQLINTFDNNNEQLRGLYRTHHGGKINNGIGSIIQN